MYIFREEYTRYEQKTDYNGFLNFNSIFLAFNRFPYVYTTVSCTKFYPPNLNFVALNVCITDLNDSIRRVRVESIFIDLLKAVKCEDRPEIEKRNRHFLGACRTWKVKMSRNPTSIT